MRLDSCNDRDWNWVKKHKPDVLLDSKENERGCIDVRMSHTSQSPGKFKAAVQN